MEAKYRDALRDLMERKGVPVEINPDAEYDFDEVSTYGWVAYEARDHCQTVEGNDRYGGCRWVVEPGAELRERTYSQFVDTDADNKNEVGINVSPVHCACGKYQDMTLRYTASLADTLRDLFGSDDSVITL